MDTCWRLEGTYVMKVFWRRPWYHLQSGWTSRLQNFFEMCFQVEPKNRATVQELLMSNFCRESCESDGDDPEVGLMCCVLRVVCCELCAVNCVLCAVGCGLCDL